jgi:hypothetical protein
VPETELARVIVAVCPRHIEGSDRLILIAGRGLTVNVILSDTVHTVLSAEAVLKPLSVATTVYE